MRDLFAYIVLGALLVVIVIILQAREISKKIVMQIADNILMFVPSGLLLPIVYRALTLA
ncbi:hypothetical protein [Ruminiclostridium cellobioparum]|uniref:Uncharacterized protein n=1 Tax=Ruminiclostridium cellobioparum subsp. termitidis CT1112 TaxID=1195236 RepID=S0FZH7_RUMCE|nr:hypothetical protein [Ruminiclostridium cellobioparum]EMS73938.1 hypothetical protein CTER_5507 [Ruminiclostridium cellobioparum subsp. termitidis CT1112]